MIAWVAGALAGGVLSNTAHTLDAGEVVVRLPTGRSGVGVGHGVELWAVPLDIGIGGPRVGAEFAAGGPDLRVSWSPSIGVKHTLHRGSARIDGTLSWSRDVHTLSLALGLDARFLRTTRLHPDDRDAKLAFDRVQSQAVLTWDVERRFRARIRLPLQDRGHTLRYGSGSVGWVHTAGALHVVLGVGMLVGRPVDGVTLGTYHWWFWQPYPEVDVALRF